MQTITILLCAAAASLGAMVNAAPLVAMVNAAPLVAAMNSAPRGDESSGATNSERNGANAPGPRDAAREIGDAPEFARPPLARRAPTAAAPEAPSDRPEKANEPRARRSTAAKQQPIGRWESEEEEDDWEEDPDRIRNQSVLQLTAADFDRALRSSGMAAAIASGPASGGAATSAPGWFSIGPRGGFGSPPRNGRATDFDVVPGLDPIVTLATGQGGLWRTNYSTWAQWTSVSDGLPTTAIGTVAVDPTNSDVILVGTGEAFRQPGIGMWRSVDGGATWSQIDLSSQIGWTPTFFSKLRFLNGGNDVIAASWSGLLHSADGGLTWSVAQVEGQAGIGIWDDVALHVGDQEMAYAVQIQSETDAGLYRTADAGATWTQLDSPVFADPKLWERASIAPGRTPEEAVAVAVQDINPVTQVTGIYRSSDSGDTWSDVTGNLAGSGFGGTQLFHVCALAMHPDDPDKLYYGAVGLAVTNDGGATWELDENVHGLEIGHADFTQLAFHPVFSSDVLFLQNDGGFYWHDFTTGDTYDALGNSFSGLVCTEVDDMDADRALIAIGTQDNGLLRSPNLGNSWDFLSGGDAGDVAIADPMARIFWAGIGVGWAWFQVVEESVSLIGSPDPGKPVFFHDREQSRVFGKTADSILERPADLSSDWVTTATGFAPSGATIREFWGSPVDARTLYVAYNAGASGDLTVLRDLEAGWTATTSEEVGGPGSQILVVHPSNEWPGEAWVGFQSGVLSPKLMHTTDFGASWEDVTGNLTGINMVTAIAVMPFDPLDIWIGTEIGVFHTQDGGDSWQPFQDGLPVAICTDLRFVLDDDHGALQRLILATDGRGVWRHDVTRPPVVYVDWRHNGAQDGSFERPFKTVIGAVGMAPEGATIAVRAGTYIEPFTFARRVTIVTWAGSSVID